MFKGNAVFSGKDNMYMLCLPENLKILLDICIYIYIDYTYISLVVFNIMSTIRKSNGCENKGNCK